MAQATTADPLDALAQQHGAIVAQGADPLDALAAEHGAVLPDTNGDTVTGFLPNLLHGLNPLPMVAGAANAIAHPIDTINGMRQFSQAERDKADTAWNAGNYLSAMGHKVNANVPLIGPALAAGGEQISRGDISGAAGSATALAATLEAPSLIADIGVPALAKLSKNRAAANIGTDYVKARADIMKSIPPSSAAPYSPVDVDVARPFLEAAHKSSPITTTEAARDAADAAVGSIEHEIGGIIAQFPTDTIRTNPLAAARAAIARNSERTDAVATGMKELDGLGLDKPLTLAEADAKRRFLNAENKAVLNRNNYDVATARTVDPGFAAREAAANSLRDGVYGQLEVRGVDDVAGLRKAEGSLIKIRNAAQRQVFNGEKNVPGSAPDSATRKIAAMSIRATPLPALVTDPVARLVRPSLLTRDEMVARSFSKLFTESPLLPYAPPLAPAAGLLTAGARPMPPIPDASFARGVPAEYGAK